MNILVIAPHPDDEVIGMGATIKKLSKKNKISLCVVSEGASAQYKDKKMIEVRMEACIKAGKILGVSDFEFLNFPDMRLDTIPHLEINVKLEKIIKKYNPEIVYTAPSNDLNKDHQKVFESTLIATRPISSGVKNILCYEVSGLVRTPFLATVYENITKEFAIKVKAFKIYKSEVMQFPHHRSIIAIENRAILRGIECGSLKAEAFQLIRSVAD